MFHPNPTQSAFAVTSGALFLLVICLAWGDPVTFLAHPARAGFAAITILIVTATALSPMTIGGVREDTRNRWIFLPFVMLGLFFAVFPPLADRLDWLTFGADGLRWAGVGLFGFGGGLRVWAMFALGPRFSGLAAIQSEHRLVTHGLYRFLRHPSYTGAVLASAGYALVFRSLPALGLVSIIVWVFIQRIQAEEALLVETFGEAYLAYRKQTWRLLPFIY